MRCLLLLLLVFTSAQCCAQDLPDFKQLNQQRINTNKTGMTVLGIWGAANVIEGIAGYSTAKDNEWRSFHQMNAIWGVVNVGIAAAGYIGARRETKLHRSYGDALHQYESTKRLFLINAGLDGLYIASGIYLQEHAKTVSDNHEVWRGYGKSILLQGAGLLIFDAVMFSAHNSKDKRWYKLLKGVSVSGAGIGFRYSIN